MPADTTVERFTGQWDKKLDTSTGLIEMGARPYDPTTGRFLSIDPIEGGSANHYDYAGQDPVNAYDLEGRAANAGPFGDRLGGPVRGIVSSVYADLRAILRRGTRGAYRTRDLSGGLEAAGADFATLTQGRTSEIRKTTGSDGGVVLIARLRAGGQVVLRPGKGTAKLPTLEVHGLPGAKGRFKFKYHS